MSVKKIHYSRHEITCLQAFYKVFVVSHLLTSGDLWPLPKPILIVYWPLRIHVVSMKCIHIFYHEISCLQGFRVLTSSDLKWPLTSTKTMWFFLLICLIFAPSLKSIHHSWRNLWQNIDIWRPFWIYAN